MYKANRLEVSLQPRRTKKGDGYHRRFKKSRQCRPIWHLNHLYFGCFQQYYFFILLRFTSLQESSIQWVVTAISFIAIFAGGFISGGRGKEKGWLVGGLTGLIYSVIIFLFQFLGLDSLFNFEQIIYHICYILIAMMGGILGVNLGGNSRSAAQ